MAVPYYALLFGGAFLLRCLVGPFEPAQTEELPAPRRNRSPPSRSKRSPYWPGPWRYG